jgi:hypothetical protein
MFVRRLSEHETIVRDAVSSIGKSPEERMAMFTNLMLTVDAITASLTTEERLRRDRIARQLDPRPEPWWRNLRNGSVK